MDTSSPHKAYVIQQHFTDPHHYDLMLEKEDFLETYSIFQEPHFQNFSQVRIQKIQPHRLLYLTYEGPISGNRGFVKIWDSGQYSWNPVLSQLTLNGKKISAIFSLFPETEPTFFLMTKLQNSFLQEP